MWDTGFFLKFLDDISPFSRDTGSPVFWTSGDVCPRFQSQGGSLTCMLCLLHSISSSDLPLVWHLTSWWPTWQPSLFDARTWKQALVEIKPGIECAAQCVPARLAYRIYIGGGAPNLHFAIFFGKALVVKKNSVHMGAVSTPRDPPLGGVKFHYSRAFSHPGEQPSVEDPAGEYPHVVTKSGGGKALVVQDYAFGKYLGYLKVAFDNNGQVKNWTGNPILLDSSVTKGKLEKMV